MNCKICFLKIIRLLELRRLILFDGNGWKMEFLKKLCIALKMLSKRFIVFICLYCFFHSFNFISPVLFISAVDSAGFDFKTIHIRFRYNTTPYKKFSLKYKQEIETPQAVYIICIQMNDYRVERLGQSPERKKSLRRVENGGAMDYCM